MARSPLSKQVIVDAAFELLAEGGLDAITARAVGARLGVRAGALYYHLPDMAALADEMATVITRRMLIPDLDAQSLSWPELLRGFAHHVREVLLSFRDGARLVAGTYITDDSVLAAGEPALRRLTEEGFSLPEATLAFRTTWAFVTGHVIEEQHREPAGRPDPRYRAEHRRARLDVHTAPLTVAANEDFLADPGMAFAWGVEALIAGIGARTLGARQNTSNHPRAGT